MQQTTIAVDVAKSVFQVAVSTVAPSPDPLVLTGIYETVLRSLRYPGESGPRGCGPARPGSTHCGGCCASLASPSPSARATSCPASLP